MASAPKVFLDSDVVMDHLADRQPFAENAHRLFALAETGKISACVSWLSFSNLYYILRKLKGHAGTLALLEKLKRITRISTVGESEIAAALSVQFSISVTFTVSRVLLQSRKTKSFLSQPLSAGILRR